MPVDDVLKTRIEQSLHDNDVVDPMSLATYIVQSVADNPTVQDWRLNPESLINLYDAFLRIKTNNIQWVDGKAPMEAVFLPGLENSTPELCDLFLEREKSQSVRAQKKTILREAFHTGSKLKRKDGTPVLKASMIDATVIQEHASHALPDEGVKAEFTPVKIKGYLTKNNGKSVFQRWTGDSGSELLITAKYQGAEKYLNDDLFPVLLRKDSRDGFSQVYPMCGQRSNGKMIYSENPIAETVEPDATYIQEWKESHASRSGGRPSRLDR